MVKSLPHETPLYNALRAAEENAEAKAKAQSIDDAMNMFRR